MMLATNLFAANINPQEKGAQIETWIYGEPLSAPKN